MKAVSLKNGIEYRLVVEGDSFKQGDTVNGSLTVKNHSTLSFISTPTVVVAIGDQKKVKAKSENAFEVLLKALPAQESIVADTSEVAAPFTFPIPLDGVVSEKSQSIFLLFGEDRESVSELAQIPLRVEPHKLFTEIYNTMEMVFQFVPKALLSKDGWTIARLSPPSSRSLTLVEELQLGLQFEDKQLRFRFNFKVKKFDTSGNSVAVGKGLKQIDCSLNRDEYSFGGEFFNQERVERCIKDALGEVSSGF